MGSLIQNIRYAQKKKSRLQFFSMDIRCSKEL